MFGLRKGGTDDDALIDSLDKIRDYIMFEIKKIKDEIFK